jgi:beta-glucanase (GH16 family)
MNNLKFKHISKFVAIFILFVTVSCTIDDKQKLENRNWQLSWSDEFDGTTAGQLPDASKWSYDIGTGDNGWGNSELQYYTNRPQNISMDGKGNLVITAIKESFQGASYTSARIKTKGVFEQKYGRFEARVKTPFGQGLWPAFWMLGNDVDTATWPLCGEIDIMELRGQTPNTILSTLHGPGYSGANAISNSYTLINGRYDTQFHLFAVEWDENKMDFFVDDYLFKRIEKSQFEPKMQWPDYETTGQWVYDHPFFLILNVAVGGNFVGDPNAQTPFPQTMTIDYVRVYNK